MNAGMKSVVSGAVVCVGAALALAGCGEAEQSSEVTTVRETVTETVETSVSVTVSPTVEGEASPSEVPTENPEVSPAQVPEGEADSQAHGFVAPPVQEEQAVGAPADTGADLGADAGGGAAFYANCSQVRAAGVAPIHAGDPGYSLDLDRDRDGVACEG